MIKRETTHNHCTKHVHRTFPNKGGKHMDQRAREGEGVLPVAKTVDSLTFPPLDGTYMLTLGRLQNTIAYTALYTCISRITTVVS